MMKSIVVRRVARGAELMDRTYPGWFDAIDLRTLNIASGRNCVLGQIHGDYVRGCRHLGIEEDALASVGYGFIAGVSAAFVPLFQTTRLTRAWRREVERRRVQAALAPEEETSDMS